MKMISMISMNLSGFGAILENLELRIVICVPFEMGLESKP